MTPDLSLYTIESTLLQLIQYREALTEDPDLTPEQQEHLISVADREIESYVTSEVGKCDRIAGMLREFEKREELAKLEAKRVTEFAKMWARRREALEDTVIRVMQMAGKTTIEGQNATLTLRKCPPSVEIKQPELIPDELMIEVVSMTRQVFLEQVAAIPGAVANSNKRHPATGNISVMLKAGRGVPGAELVTDKVRLEVK